MAGERVLVRHTITGATKDVPRASLSILVSSGWEEAPPPPAPAQPKQLRHKPSPKPAPAGETAEPVEGATTEKES